MFFFDPAVRADLCYQRGDPVHLVRLDGLGVPMHQRQPPDHHAECAELHVCLVRSGHDRGSVPMVFEVTIRTAKMDPSRNGEICRGCVLLRRQRR